MKLFGKISNRKRNGSVFCQLFYRGRSDNTRNDRTISDILRTSEKLVPIGTKSLMKKIAEDHYYLFRQVTTISEFKEDS